LTEGAILRPVASNVYNHAEPRWSTQKLFLGTFALVAFATIGSASAADLPPAPVYKAPAPPAPMYGWTGFYVGANAGYGWDTRPTNFSGTPNIAIEFTGGVLPTSLSPNPKGWLGGAQLGYNWQFAPAWVAGLEADIAGAGIKGTASVSPVGTVKAEYLYVDLGTQSVTAPTNAPGIVTLTASHTFMENIFRVGVNYKFGGP
jgi:opacity protein-like surface antigen